MDKIKNELITWSNGHNQEKIRENRLRWFGYIEGRNNDELGEIRVKKNRGKVGPKEEEMNEGY